MGPAEAPVLKVKSEFRYQILLKAVRRAALRDVLKKLRSFAESEKWKATALVIDVDPISLM
jgi:primosomal protein N' (replication factor Y)